jgi:HPt (histidine-containing phosphotransfer) domain-containing protein
MDDYLSKPLKQEDFARSLASWLRHGGKPQPEGGPEDCAQPRPANGGEARDKAEMAATAPESESRPDSSPASASAQAASSALNAGVISRLRELQAATDPSLMNQIFAAFISDGAERIRILKNSLAEHDSEALRKTAHALKGASSTIGAQRMADIALRLEMLATTMPMTEASTLAAQIEDEFERVKAELAKLDTDT